MFIIEKGFMGSILYLFTVWKVTTYFLP